MMVWVSHLFPAERTLFKPARRADGALPIFCVARFSRTDLSMIGARVLKSVELPTGGMPPTYETMH
jgi:hypothetical protein